MQGVAGDPTERVKARSPGVRRNASSLLLLLTLRYLVLEILHEVCSFFRRPAVRNIRLHCVAVIVDMARARPVCGVYRRCAMPRSHGVSMPRPKKKPTSVPQHIRSGSLESFSTSAAASVAEVTSSEPKQEPDTAQSP